MLGRADHITAIDEPKAELLALLGTSGLTAAIGLNEAARIKANEIVLITAAAGGLGHLAAQYAALKGCRIIALTSTEEKADFLRSFHFERVINYRKEDLSSVLAVEYPVSITSCQCRWHSTLCLSLFEFNVTEWHRCHLGNGGLASLRATVRTFGQKRQAGQCGRHCWI